LPVSFLCSQYKLDTNTVCTNLLQYIYDDNENKKFIVLSSEFPLKENDDYIVSLLIDYLETHWGSTNMDKQRSIIYQTCSLIANMNFLHFAYEVQFPLVFEKENEKIVVQNTKLIGVLSKYADLLINAKENGIICNDELIEDYILYLMAFTSNGRYIDNTLLEKVNHFFGIYNEGKNSSIIMN
jgi:hypothetical protein